MNKATATTMKKKTDHGGNTVEDGEKQRRYLEAKVKDLPDPLRTYWKTPNPLGKNVKERNKKPNVPKGTVIFHPKN